MRGWRPKTDLLLCRGAFPWKAPKPLAGEESADGGPDTVGATSAKSAEAENDGFRIVALADLQVDHARRFAAEVEVVIVGINVPIPVPVAHHGFGGWKRPGFGDLDQYEMDGVCFWSIFKSGGHA